MGKQWQYKGNVIDSEPAEGGMRHSVRVERPPFDPGGLLSGLAVGGLILATVVMVGIVTGWFAEHPEVTVGLIVGAALTVLFTALIAGGIVGAKWTERQVRLGAGISAHTQDVSAMYSAAMSQAAANMAKIVVTATSQAARQAQLEARNTPALPLPQGQDWLPALAEFTVNEPEAAWGEVVEGDR